MRRRSEKMVSITEHVRDLDVRVLKWNENLHNVGESEGLFYFRVNNATQRLPLWKLCVFDLRGLSNRESIKQLVSKATEESGLFSEETSARLTKDITCYLLSCFKFHLQQSPRKPIIVIMVDLHYWRTMRYTRRKRASMSSAAVFSSSPKKAEQDIDVIDVSESGSKKQKVADSGEEEEEKEEKKKRKKKKRKNSEWEWVLPPRRELKSSEVQKIRGILVSALEEPMVLWVKRRVTNEPLGLSQVDPKLELMKEFDGDHDDQKEEIDTCSICLEGICRGTMVVKTPCSHLFHKNCLFKWLPTNNGCPLCRSICSTLV